MSNTPVVVTPGRSSVWYQPCVFARSTRSSIAAGVCTGATGSARRGRRPACQHVTHGLAQQPPLEEEGGDGGRQEVHGELADGDPERAVSRLDRAQYRDHRDGGDRG